MAKNTSLKEMCSKIVTLYHVLKPQRWNSLDAIIFIEDYLKEHPEKKPTRWLMHKLEREFYRSKRSDKK